MKKMNGRMYEARNEEPRERCIQLATYLIEHKSTVRQTAAYFSLSKSTVHKDISVRLADIDHGMYERAKEILDLNKSERHLRGGEATRKKYLKRHAPQKV